MNDDKTNIGDGEEKISPLVMFPSSKNFKLENEYDPLQELMDEFGDYEESSVESNFDPDKTYIRTLDPRIRKKDKDIFQLMEKFNFYLTEIDQYWHD